MSFFHSLGVVVIDLFIHLRLFLFFVYTCRRIFIVLIFGQRGSVIMTYPVRSQNHYGGYKSL